MTKDELVNIAEIFASCNNKCPDNNKVFRLASYDRPSDMGPALHIDYLIIGNACFIISAEDRALFERYLNE